MPISVRHDSPSPVLGSLISSVGQARSADKQGALDEERARWILGYKQNQQQIGESQRQFDVNAALRVRAMDIEQRQYQQNLARQDATQQYIAANQEANRQAELYAMQMREEYDLAAQQQAQMFQWAANEAKSLDQQVNEAVKGIQQMKLTPEGQRIANSMMGSYRELQDQTASVRPQVKAELYNQWLNKLESIGLDAYAIQEPSAAEKVYSGLVPLQGQQIVPGQALPPGTYRSLKGTRNGVEQWENLVIPEPVSPTFSEDAVKNWTPAPDGGFFMRQPDGKIQHVPPAKPKKPPVDFGKYIKQATSDLIAAHSSANPESTAAYSPSSDDIKKKARELWQLEKELEAELGGEATEGGSGEISPPQPPVSVSSMEEAMQVPVGGSFIYNGQTFIVTGPGEAEPL